MVWAEEVSSAGDVEERGVARGESDRRGGEDAGGVDEWGNDVHVSSMGDSEVDLGSKQILLT